EYAPTQDVPENPILRSLEDLYLNNEYWYGRLTVSIHGSGERRGDLGGVETLTIARDANISFRLRAVPGELGMVSLLDELNKKHSFELPAQATRGLEAARSRRHWVTELGHPTSEDKTAVHISVQDHYSASNPKVELGELREEAGWSKQTLEGGWTETLERSHSLEIDAKKGTYSFSLGTLAGGLVKFQSSSSAGPGKTSEQPTGLQFFIKDQKLSGMGGTIHGSSRIPRDKLDYSIQGIQGGWTFGFGRVKGLITWTFSPVPLDDVELVLAPAGYDQWLPRGGTAEGQKGNSLPIEARVQHRGGGSTKARMTRLSVWLKEVSREPGVCLNVPLEKGGDTFDLQFAPGGGYTVDEEGTRVIKKGSEFDRLELTLDCYDWGAWGTVVAEAMLKDGRVLFATLDKDPSEDELRVPKRDPDSKIADKWKKEMNADGLKDRDDQEPQKGNPNKGDGLTVYEEYRGMIAKGKHTRDYPAGPDGFRPLSPRRKDLIVCNTIRNEPAVVAGFRLLEKAADIHVVEVEEKDLPESRQVNINLSPTMSAGPQHGLKLFDVVLPPGTVGDTPRDYNKPAGSRERYNRVQVDLKQIRSLYKGDVKLPWTVDTEISQTVAHELAHGLDLDHHGDDNHVKIQDPSRLAIYDRSKTKITLSQVEGSIGQPGSEASGDVRCIMCYNDAYNWSYHSPSYLFMGSVTPPGSIFCVSRDGTGHNADFEIVDPQNPARRIKIPGVFGKATAGPCLPMMRIKDPSK
ncbi:MAG TPA: hypothetical protein VKW04_10905, partial [Planctomycetota bacterium]|nr:hypothetical protein [Planctomycetota bacterium]